MKGSIDNQAASLAETVIERTVELARIPAPPYEEARRASLVEAWWNLDALNSVRKDREGNVRAMARERRGAPVVVCAHLDTVFGHDVPHRVHRRGGRLHGPSVGDDSLGVAALSAVASLLPRDLPGGVEIIATVGEEGRGNLRGIRQVLASMSRPPAAVIAIEGNYLGRLSTVAVGSLRLRVGVRGPGGHAWERREAPSAVHACAQLISHLASLRQPGSGWSLNVGRMGGGEAVNARAREAWFEVDIRADRPEALASLASQATEQLHRQLSPDLDTFVEELGRRPAGGIDPEHPLVLAAREAHEANGIEPSLVSTSTDANAAHAEGIPAIAIGVSLGEQEHTPEEWIELEPIPRGLQTVADTITNFVERLR